MSANTKRAVTKKGEAAAAGVVDANDVWPAVEAAPTSALIIPFLAEPALDLSMVLPTYNESENIAEAVAQLVAVLNGVPGLRYEIIVVDDDSPDRTWELAHQLRGKYPALRVIRRQGERGLATAVVRGWQQARGSGLGVIDADLQHPPEMASKLWEAIANGADLAVASRHVEGGSLSDWKLHRRVISRGAQTIGLLLLPEVVAKVKDPMSGYMMIRRTMLEGRELQPLGYKILLEVLARAPLSAAAISEVPYTFRERNDGKSKVTTRVYAEYLQHLLRLRVLSIKRLLGIAK